MKIYIATSIENEFQEEVYKKTRKNEYPKLCDGCEKKIKKGMFWMESDGGDAYCLKCCQ